MSVKKIVERVVFLAGRFLSYVDARRPLRVIWNTLKGFVDDDCLDRAAAVSFYALLSFIPFLIIVGAMLGLFIDHLSTPDTTPQQLIATVRGYLKIIIPYLQDEQVTGFLSLSRHTASLSTIGFLSLAVSASLLFSTLSDTLNRIFGTKPIHFVFSRLVGFLIIVALTLLLFFLHYFSAMVLSVVTLLRDQFPAVQPVIDFLTGNGLLWSIPIITLFILLFFSILIYAFTMAARIHFVAVIGGALLFSGLWNGAKYLFNVYITKLSSYSIVYGSATWFAAAILWVYYSILLLLLSMEFIRALNGEIGRKKGDAA